ncbi:MAG: helix-turn-helix domain-containing protein [Nitrospirota bacterium]|jgi:AraC-like DNA-binding protein
MNLPERAPPAQGSRCMLLAPRPSLAACVRGHIVRSTVGLELDHEQRFNHFPASPLCAICWLFQGEAAVVRRGEQWVCEATPRIALIGPHSGPVVSHNPGVVEALMVAMTPAAVYALSGVSINALVNRVVPLETVFDASWLAMAQAVLQAPDDASRIRLVEEFLEPRWALVRDSAVSRADRFHYWVENLGLRALQSGVGSSLRQAERRIKQWAGMPMRDLRRMVRAEDAFFRAAFAYEDGSLDLAGVAADGGYADQAHMCREVRRITGLSPVALLKAIERDEMYWMYRLRDV